MFSWSGELVIVTIFALFWHSQKIYRWTWQGNIVSGFTWSWLSTGVRLEFIGAWEMSEFWQRPKTRFAVTLERCIFTITQHSFLSTYYICSVENKEVVQVSSPCIGSRATNGSCLSFHVWWLRVITWPGSWPPIGREGKQMAPICVSMSAEQPAQQHNDHFLSPVFIALMGWKPSLPFPALDTKIA